ncbi:MAG: DUF4336 domain-containing protein [Myxococcales bacterium]|nr:DUF4336 domain-containing protein [Myxococcales bacterium]
MLEALGEGLWTAWFPLKLLGTVFGTRMTVARLPDGSLWVHSPIRCDDALRAEIDALGPVKHLVAPNMFHHLFLPKAKSHWPDAKVWLAPGLDQKRADITFDALLPTEAPEDWQGAIDVARLEGMPKVNETVFLHRPSRTLVVTDVVFNFVEPVSFGLGLLLMMTGAKGKLTTSRLYRGSIKDRAAYDRSMQKVLGWDFDNISVCHGALVRGDGRRRFEAAIG